MKNVTQEERWAAWLVQSRHFEDREQFFDAVERAALVERQVRTALETEADRERHTRLGRLHARAARQLAEVSVRRDAWREKCERLKRGRLEGAEAEMKRPLPEGLPGRPRA